MAHPQGGGPHPSSWRAGDSKPAPRGTREEPRCTPRMHPTRPNSTRHPLSTVRKAPAPPFGAAIGLSKRLRERGELRCFVVRKLHPEVWVHTLMESGMCRRLMAWPRREPRGEKKKFLGRGAAAGLQLPAFAPPCNARAAARQNPHKKTKNSVRLASSQCKRCCRDRSDRSPGIDEIKSRGETAL